MEYNFKDAIFNPCQWLRREAPYLYLRGVLRSGNECGYETENRVSLWSGVAASTKYEVKNQADVFAWASIYAKKVFFKFNRPMSKTVCITKAVLGKYVSQ